MPTITILPELLINKIAAGEVIERPASIVRELLDNSIDAGAKRISVEILYGGKKLIKVSDDGSGMDRDDATLCFERHSTSKIRSEDDLFNIKTLGFRGEALASIASISKVTLITSSLNSEAGTKIEISGQGKAISGAPPLQGTTLEIRDIFYNTPARRKFLKSIPTELSHIIDIVTQKAFAYPEISFLLKHNDTEIINVPQSAGQKERFSQLYGGDLFKEFIEVNKGGKGISISGFTSVAEFARSSKNHQLIFINRRPVKNPTISHAAHNAYRDVMPKDRYPAFFLFFDVDPQKVDVNVHPAKREVRFESPDEIYRIVESSIKEALHQKQKKDTGLDQYADRHQPAAGYQPSYGGHFVRETLESAFQTPAGPQTDFFIEKIIPPVHTYFYIGESFFAEIAGKGLVIIDQHAAHERVLYEKFLKKVGLDVEDLFLPVRVELPAKEFNIIMNNKDIFHDFGLHIEEFGVNNLIIKALPKAINKADIKGLLMDIASVILEENIPIGDASKKDEILKKIAAGIACHKAVRGREQLSNEELSQLIASLDKTEAPDKCPHGRPTRIFFSLDDLNKMFKRK
ncbi:MAG: DNA mismatch repair endonuclease MutL [Nitrospirae bacterium]|nr:DNA mismatch repair endonuclease MutL [Nitrospirota bacterium]